MGLMYHSHSAASFLRLAKHVQGVRPDGSTFKRTHKKWQQASFIHIVFKSSIKYNQAIMPKRIWERKSAVFNVKQLFQHFYAKPRKIKAEKLIVFFSDNEEIRKRLACVQPSSPQTLGHCLTLC